MLGGAVTIVNAKIALAHELIGIRKLRIFKALFKLTALKDLQRIGIQAIKKVLVATIGIGV